jgi:transposase InsO family protein
VRNPEVIMKKKDEEWALFWCSLLHPALFGEIEEREIQSFLKELAGAERVFPDGRRKKPSLSTLRRKLNLYREGGLEALPRKIRQDRGKPRARRQSAVERAVELKCDQPRRSHLTINEFLQAEGKEPIPKSSLYRYLKRAGATRLKLGVTKKPVRRRWTRDHTHDLWIGDFEEGPYVLHEAEAVPTHLSAFIDCHSRFVVEGRYYYRQTLDVLIDSLLRAWAIHGAPSEIYVDQAKVYLSRALRSACYALHINLLHRKKGDPPPGGLIEKFFQTAQGRLEAEVRAGRILTLGELNRALTAWLEVSHHRTPHSETGQSPRERYEQGLRVIRAVDMERALRYFLRRERRTVHKDFSDVQLDRRFFKVDKRFRGDRVEVRYDPFSAPESVLIYSLSEEYLGKGTLHNRQQGEDSGAPPQPHKPQNNYLELLVQRHERELREKAQGIDYREVLQHRSWPFANFTKLFSELLGRKGGPSAFSAGELESLRKIYNRHSALTEALLTEAFDAATERTIPHIAYELQRLRGRKDR